MKKTISRVFLVLLTLALAASTASATVYTIPAGSGTYTFTAIYTTPYCTYGDRGQKAYWSQYQYSSFSYTVSGQTYYPPVEADWYTTSAQPLCDVSNSYPPIGLLFFGPEVEITLTTSDGPAEASAVVTPLTRSTFDPDYKVVSILYSPPGNQSSQGYSNSTTSGTTTTVASSFTFSSELTFSSGIPDVLGGSASVGYATTSNNSSAFTQTWTDATAITSDDNSNSTYNPTGSSAVNHNLDEFVIWLNPQVTVFASGATAVSYTTSSQATPGVSAVVADTVTLPAITMEATPAGPTGVTTVPVGYLIPQAIAGEDGVNSYMPGLGAICANATLYKEQLASADPATPTACTQANQCGCKPSDFVGILQADPLLNYNGTTLTASPYAGTVDPLTLDPSGVSTCGENPVPTTARCRYQIVPITTGSTTPLFEPLSGDEYPTFTLSDSTGTSETTGHIDTHIVGLSFGGGPLVASLKTTDTWTWTDGESWGKINGTANTMFVTLKTSNADCVEDVNIYEDTEFHTFAFQVPEGITTCP